MSLVSVSRLKDLQRRIDALRMQNYDYMDKFKIVPSQKDFAEAVQGFAFDPWQDSYLGGAVECSRIAIAASRQSGKSTVTAAFVGWCLVFIPNFECLIASRSLRQASHFLLKVREYVLSVVPKEAMVQLNRLSMELPNGSSAISIPAMQPDAGRGFSPQLVVLDEAAFAPEELFAAIFPSVAATKGAVHMISSPNGRFGRFFEAFEGEAVDVYRSFRVTWQDCPRMTEEEMEIERKNLGMLKWRQEFMAEFITPEGAFFDATSLLAFEDGAEDFDLTDLGLDDMEDILTENIPELTPTAEDLKAALDAADRVNRMVYEHAA